MWPEIELAASQPEESRRLQTAGGTLAPILLMAAVLVLTVIASLIPQISGTFEGASPAPVASPELTASPTLDPELWDPTFYGGDHDTWDVIADLVPQEGSGLIPRHYQLRAAWVDGKLCYMWQMRLGSEDAMREGSGNCATWDELTVDRGTTGHVVEVVDAELIPLEYHLGWAILNPDIARVEVHLATGETLAPELLSMDPGPRGETVRFAWVQTLSPMVDLIFYDAAGDRVNPPPLQAP